MDGRTINSGTNGGRGRLLAIWDSVRVSFGFPSGVAMALGILLGLILPMIDNALEVTVPVLTFDSQSAARGLLETIATATTAVAGLSFSVTVVALTLASSQLSPRVLRSFRSDRLSQITLALFLGTFVYSLALLVWLGTSNAEADPPNLSMTVAILLALAAFATFAGFIAHIIDMLQPSSVIASVRNDAVNVIESHFPAGPGEPDDRAEAARAAADAIAQVSGEPVMSASSGYLNLIDTGPIIEAASDCGAIVQQVVFVGDYVLPGQTIAECPTPQNGGGGGGESVAQALADSVRRGFVLGPQRTLVQDVAFPIRQLADIALKGLSPGINDPTTSENAIDAMGSLLIEFARAEQPSAVRVGDDGAPRFVARVPELDDLVHLGFEQVRGSAEAHPVFLNRMLKVLGLIEADAKRRDLKSQEPDRQRKLIERMLERQSPP